MLFNPHPWFQPAPERDSASLRWLACETPIWQICGNHPKSMKQCYSHSKWGRCDRTAWFSRNVFISRILSWLQSGRDTKKRASLRLWMASLEVVAAKPSSTSNKWWRSPVVKAMIKCECTIYIWYMIYLLVIYRYVSLYFKWSFFFLKIHAGKGAHGHAACGQIFLFVFCGWGWIGWWMRCCKRQDFFVKSWWFVDIYGGDVW